MPPEKDKSTPRTETESPHCGPDNESGEMNKESVKAKRIAVLETVEQLLEDIEERTGQHLGRVWQSVNNAREYLLNDGEYNHHLRFALLQLEQVVKGLEEDTAEPRLEITELRKDLSEKAALPPQDQITR